MFRKMLAVAALMIPTAVANAQSVAFSSWDSVYQAAGGFNVRAEVELNGGSGSYRTHTGQHGWLENVNYFGSVGSGETIVTGSWRFENGATGQFKFIVDPTGTSFRGYWWFNGGGEPVRFWNGSQRPGVGGPIGGPIGGPVAPPVYPAPVPAPFETAW